MPSVWNWEAGCDFRASGWQGWCLLPIQIKSARNGEAQSLDVWVDTACTTDLVLPQSEIEALGLPVSGRVITIPSDGRRLSSTKLLVLDRLVRQAATSGSCQQ